MASLNGRKLRNRNTVSATERTAGGAGKLAAIVTAERQLERLTLVNLMWEKLAYSDGEEVAEAIKKLVPIVSTGFLTSLILKVRLEQKLRHTPLYLSVLMAMDKNHRKYTRDLISTVCNRADMMAEWIAIYEQTAKTRTLPKQAKLGLADAFGNFKEYHFAKYKGVGKSVSLKDAMCLVHPRPANRERSKLYAQIKGNTLPAPNTWETRLSAGEDKKEVFTDLIQTGKIGAMAFLRNLRNMEEAKVSPKLIREGFSQLNGGWLLPKDYLAAAVYAPKYVREIESMMLRSLSELPKLKGHTVLGIDTSGSMSVKISGKSEFSRQDVAVSIAILAAEICESLSVYVTASRHAPVKLARGFALKDNIENASRSCGSGGIYTRQFMDYVDGQELERPDRVIVFSDSQDCDRDRRLPKMVGEKNYIVDVSSHKNGIDYKGTWDASVSGWSDSFLTYILALEAEDN